MPKRVGDTERIIQPIITISRHCLAQRINCGEQIIGRIITQLLGIAQRIRHTNQTAFGIITQLRDMAFRINHFNQTAFPIILITSFLSQRIDLAD